ncbi:hypothetical protein CHY_1550 [Carboxydothermus hydrogenoformans Z-2901]|uniref:Uncharacterized protein n=1 Tax=Carboxydothermus hydrogenoformans (strain ATCC BAA-161 / DSM 6008 / Z-2901) TaxID=246194 RepID=Q3ABV2_CARHZ|nr:hypothetical protein CHY_1550 [Carboxydothermus hydrogenoformans Z-2901]
MLKKVIINKKYQKKKGLKDDSGNYHVSAKNL